MKTRTIGLSIAFALLGGASPFALQACSSSTAPPATVGGGDDSSTNFDGVSTTRPDTSPGADTAPPTGDSGGGGGDSAPFNDGAPNTFDAADIPDGGRPVTPDSVMCGSAPCSTTSSTCCVQADAAATCEPGATASCPNGSAAIHCLGATDCTGGFVCCGTLNPQAGTASTSCAASPCGSGFTSAQFCGTNSECPNKDCTIQICPSPAFAANGQKLQLCGGVHAGCQ